MLPDVDADNRDQSQQGVLVRSGRDLQPFGGWVQSLDALLDTELYKKTPRTSHPQPEPWIPAVVALKVFFRFSKEPKDSSIAVFKGPSFKVPPFPPLAPEGVKFLQNKEWLI